MKREAKERVLQAIEEIRKGKMVILVDDEDRENEGDLCLAAEFVTAEDINFMAKYGRGLVCLTMTPERVRDLELAMMVDSNRASRRTAFTVSIEARTGVTTGISAADRAHTIRTAIAKDTHPADLVSPGHVFPLRARPGGVLQRTGHTEGSVDLAKLAGALPAAVICEIMKDDGTMARMTDLVDFAKTHKLHIVSIADVVQYRMQNERLVHRVTSIDTAFAGYAGWQAHVYESTVEGRQIVAMTHGTLSAEPTLVRVHTTSILADVVGMSPVARTTIRESIAAIEHQGSGVVLVMASQKSLSDELRQLGIKAEASVQNGEQSELREYGLGAQVLRDLGLEKIRILTRLPRKIIGLEGYGLEVIEQVSVEGVFENTDSGVKSPAPPWNLH